jgi:hypothetical protein
MHRTRILPADRFFARVDKFECECPSCGRLLFSTERPPKASRLQSRGRQRGDIRETPRTASVWDLVWNPLSQRLRCPWCGIVYLIGLVAFPVKHGARRPLKAPPDTIPDKRQLLELRRRTGGWWAKAHYAEGQEVNLVVDEPCICPPNGWAVACPIHGVERDPDI